MELEPNNIDSEIHIPYNINNILITEPDILYILNKYDVKITKINKIEYIQQAFVHKSYCKKKYNYSETILNNMKLEINNDKLLDLFDNNNERLEYLGDRVLKLCISMYLYFRYPNQEEGFMTRLQTKIEDKYNLAFMSRELELEKYFIINRQTEISNSRNLDKLHEDMFESLIGGLFLSEGFELCLLLISNLLDSLIDYSEKLYCDSNYKDHLLRVYHQHKWDSPKYELIEFTGDPHKRKFTFGVRDVNNTFIGYGIGNSKKDAEQKASKMALIKLGSLNKDQYTEEDIFYPNLNNTL